MAGPKKIKRWKHKKTGPNDTNMANGDWKKTVLGTMLLKCPDCGFLMHLANVNVLVDGQVAAKTDSIPKKVKCPAPGCNFHDFIELEGANDAADPDERLTAAGLGGPEPELTV